MKPLLYKIGIILSQLGNELKEHAQFNQQLNIHGQVKQTMDYITFYLHNLNATLDKHRQSASKNWENQYIVLFIIYPTLKLMMWIQVENWCLQKNCVNLNGSVKKC